jgi:ankyrin repeat protein
MNNNYVLIPTKQDKKGRTPAHCGSAKGQLETLKILAANKANLWMTNVRGDLPLHEGVHSGRKDLVRWLLSLNSAASNASNNDGKCPLHIAAITNNVEMCKVMLKKASFFGKVF